MCMLMVLFYSVLFTEILEQSVQLGVKHNHINKQLFLGIVSHSNKADIFLFQIQNLNWICKYI